MLGEIQSILHVTDTGLVGRVDYALLSYERLHYLAYACVPVKPQVEAVRARNREDLIIMALERAEGCQLRQRILLEVRTCLAYPDEILPGDAHLIEAHIEWFPAWGKSPAYGRTYRHSKPGRSQVLSDLFAAHIAGDLETVLARPLRNAPPGGHIEVPQRQHVYSLNRASGLSRAPTLLLHA
ncbi:MAG: hypothetical protein AAB365_00245 [Patescibacteria group bacterium]